AELAGGLDLAAGLAQRRHAVERGGQAVAQLVGVHAGRQQQRLGRAAVLVDQREHDVRGGQAGVVAADRQALGIGQGLLEAGGELVHAHGGLRWGLQKPRSSPMQKKKPSAPAKAYKNPEFLLSPEARTIRMLCEYVEPQTRLARHGVSRAIIFWGSARIRPKPKSGPDYF